MKRLITILSLFGAALLAGCGGQQQVALSYGGVGADAQLAAAPANGGKKVYLEPFGDKRPVKDDIGDLYNGYGIKLRDVVLTNDAGETVTDAVKQELEQAGYQVVMATPGDQPADAPVLTGHVVGLECCVASLASGMTSKLSIDASMSAGGVERLDRIYTGEGSKRALFLFGQSDYQEAMSGALQNAVEQLVADVNQQSL
jgi:hypothetical protein